MKYMYMYNICIWCEAIKIRALFEGQGCVYAQVLSKSSRVDGLINLRRPQKGRRQVECIVHTYICSICVNTHVNK